MKIVIFCNKNMEHQNFWGSCFANGLLRHNITPFWSAKHQLVDCDIAVLWGVHNQAVIHHQIKTRRQYLVLERGYFNDRFVYTSIGWNGLNGLADFKNVNSPPDRWQKHGVPINEWKQSGKYILLLGQVIGDASTKMLNSLTDWYTHIVVQIRKYTDRPIHFRLHPLSRKKFIVPGTVHQSNGTLIDALNDAHCAIAYSSNSLVDAVINGVPSFAFSKIAMAYPMCAHDIAEIEKPIKPNRDQWLANLAYAQWTPDEIQNGDAWEHLKP